MYNLTFLVPNEVTVMESKQISLCFINVGKNTSVFNHCLESLTVLAHHHHRF